GRSGLDACGRFQFQHAENRVEAVTAHVAECAATEIVPPAPDEWQVSAVESAFRRRSKPQVPVEAFGHRLCFFRTIQALWPIRTTRPVNDLPHRTDGAVPNPFAEEARGFRSLIAHGDLRCGARLARDFGHASRFINRSRHWLL